MADTNKGGRPRKELSFKTLNKLIQIQCTAEECASVLGVSSDTLDRRLREEFGVGFAEYYKTHGHMGKVSLRRMQWKSAQKGNVTMQIWLGKQMLGQADKSETEVTSPDGSLAQVNHVTVFQLPDNGRG